MSTSNLCPVCRGSCNVVTFSHGIQYWPCVACGGAGVRVQHGPAVVVTHGRPAKKRKARAPVGETVPFRGPITLREGNAAARRAAEAYGLSVSPRIAAANLA